MKKQRTSLHKAILLGAMALGVTFGADAQRQRTGLHTDKFEPLDPIFASPNNYRTASGAPGHEYWQQQVDYDIDITLDDEKQTITGSETIHYVNNSPDPLEYIWIQLDQNVRSKESDSYKIGTSRMRENINSYSINQYLGPDFDGGFKVSKVADGQGKALPNVVNNTMMRIDLPKTLNPGESTDIQIDWFYNINDRMKIGGRSGYEYFEDDDNYLYTIAQFFPRAAVYNDYDGWQNKQFYGAGEFTLPFGDYKVDITVPADHVVGATGVLQNPKDVLTADQMAAYEKAKTADEPVIIVSQKEAERKEKRRADGTVTWTFEAENVRDFAFASSRKFIWDAQGVEIGGNVIMAESLYPKEGNPLWEEYSTRAVVHTLEIYSQFTIDYPYPKAISVNAARIGMEYPMICFNFGRTNEDGSYSDQTKYGMIGVIIHEVGHNFFPMIINSDERQWTWMDEGLNSFVEYLAEVRFEDHMTDNPFPVRGGVPKYITPYMSADPELISPIMTTSDNVQRLGPNAYTKPATALNILRETVMGPELFDAAFKTYSERWAFKHPTPEDFFRSMEDASAVDLDWFWRGWFYTTDHVDIAMKEVNHYQLTDNSEMATMEGEDRFAFALLDDAAEARLGDDPHFYEIKLENVGGLVMPLIFEFTYEDGTTEEFRIPAEIWRKNAEEISKVFYTTQKVVKIQFDPNEELADTDVDNNVWPASEQPPSRVDAFREGRGE
ncbi:MAG TPA: aminopeptidase [Cytophagales bacterium]|nr:aminopeptidase [Cytophagales bacterium]HAP62256.1 aminopeptidase [Cytophagales bacterium]